MSLNLAHPLFVHAAARPDHPALHIDGRSHSYGELKLRAQQVGTWVGAARRVGVLAGRSLEAYAGILGVSVAGATWVPINIGQPPARIAALLQQAQLDALIVDDAGEALLTAELLAVAPARVLVSGAADTLALAPLADVAPDQVVYMIFTSGTTGLPKGVMITAANVAGFLRVMLDRYAFAPADKFLQVSELSFDLSILPVWAAFASGATLYVIPEAQRLAPTKLVREHALTIWVSTPSAIVFLHKLRQAQPGSLPSVRASIFCGEALPLAAATAWQAACPNAILDNQYGPTEATCSCMVERFTTGEASVTPGRGIVSIGRAYPGMRSAIVSDGRFLPRGEPGELALAGDQVMAGYFGDDELTRKKLVPLPESDGTSARWYLTGDLAYEDAHGNFHHLGRVDNQIKVRGYRVELEEIDFHLRAICGSDLVATVGWPIEGGAVQGLVVFVSGCELTEAQILEQLAGRVAPHMQPRRVVKLPSLPLSLNGKIDRNALLKTLA